MRQIYKLLNSISYVLALRVRATRGFYAAGKRVNAHSVVLPLTGKRYILVTVAIQGFKCRDTQELFETGRSQRFGAIRKAATRKLTMLQAATVLDDLKSPPGNRLEELVRDRVGQHSIRINDHWRVCFVWTATGPTDVEITSHYA